MGRYCCVVGCKSRSHDYKGRKISNGIRFFTILSTYITSLFFLRLNLCLLHVSSLFLDLPLMILIVFLFTDLCRCESHTVDYRLLITSFCHKSKYYIMRQNVLVYIKPVCRLIYLLFLLIFFSPFEIKSSFVG